MHTDGTKPERPVIKDRKQTHAIRPAEPPASPQSSASALPGLRRALEHSAPYGWIRNRAVDVQFRFWRYRHPGASFAEFYAARVERKLDLGRPHKTLGSIVSRPRGGKPVGTTHGPESFARTGTEVFEDIVALAGLFPGDVVADFGCGSLRVGQHFMRRIAPGDYWGLDIADRFYREGAAAMGAEAIARFRPNLRVLGEASLAEAAAARPSLVISVAVLKHVPQSEWGTYFDRLMGLVSAETRLVVTLTTGASAERIGGAGWSYRLEDVAAEIERRRPGARITTRRPGRVDRKDPEREGKLYLLATWPGN